MKEGTGSKVDGRKKKYQKEVEWMVKEKEDTEVGELIVEKEE